MRLRFSGVSGKMVLYMISSWFYEFNDMAKT
jgi:hypothetical protein